MSDINKKVNSAPAVDTAPAADTGDDMAADLDAVMRKYDRESATRIWEGTPKIIITAIMAIFSLYCLYMTLFSTALPEVRLTLFVGCIIILGFLTYPAKKGHVHVNSMPWYDIVLMVVGSACFFYFAANALPLIKLAYRPVDGHRLRLLYSGTAGGRAVYHPRHLRAHYGSWHQGREQHGGGHGAGGL